jgi:hypothetical protein
MVAILLTPSFRVSIKIEADLKQEKVEAVQGTLTKKSGICNFSRERAIGKKFTHSNSLCYTLPSASI